MSLSANGKYRSRAGDDQQWRAKWKSELSCMLALSQELFAWDKIIWIGFCVLTKFKGLLLILATVTIILHNKSLTIISGLKKKKQPGP